MSILESRPILFRHIMLGLGLEQGLHTDSNCDAVTVVSRGTRQAQPVQIFLQVEGVGTDLRMITGGIKRIGLRAAGPSGRDNRRKQAGRHMVSVGSWRGEIIVD